ncbi:25761_t:CDS:2 [Dentiscutata erythropus]|uniref:25761_t:CDS:1 n=1 Tax=Dentiscutata erythropus TaxID=1348616 RepID=A0A9N9IHC0_9GLOM|nr:25761_t:CDS:2 [Dentiscutata erythropus]
MGSLSQKPLNLSIHNDSTVIKSSTPTKKRIKTRSRTLIAPTLVTVKNPKTLCPFVLEYSIHIGSTRFNRELLNVFSQIVEPDNFLVIPVFLKCQNDLVGIGERINREKDEKLEDFVEWGKAICQKLRGLGYWADLTDPASGYPIFSDPGPSTYPDVHGAEQLLKYDIYNAGCCHILLHPKWGSKVYPGTLFTTANENCIKQVINESIFHHSLYENNSDFIN